jgi:hypothetical protein
MIWTEPCIKNKYHTCSPYVTRLNNKSGVLITVDITTLNCSGEKTRQAMYL